MTKMQNSLDKLGERISHKSEIPLVYERFNTADKILDVAKQKTRDRVIRKSYALTKNDLENIELIKDKCLNKKVVLSDSLVIRLAINLAKELSDKDLIEASKKIPKYSAGRPKKGEVVK